MQRPSVASVAICKPARVIPRRELCLLFFLGTQATYPNVTFRVGEIYQIPFQVLSILAVKLNSAKCFGVNYSDIMSLHSYSFHREYLCRNSCCWSPQAQQSKRLVNIALQWFAIDFLRRIRYDNVVTGVAKMQKVRNQKIQIVNNLEWKLVNTSSLFSPLKFQDIPKGTNEDFPIYVVFRNSFVSME